jgi:hypothetical protein
MRLHLSCLTGRRTLLLPDLLLTLSIDSRIESGSSSNGFGGLMSSTNNFNSMREKRISVPFLNPRLISQSHLPSQGGDEEVNVSALSID